MFFTAEYLYCCFVCAAPACSDGEALSITTTFQHDCQHVTFKCTINSSCCSNLAQFVINNTTRYPDWSNGTQYYLTTHNQEDTSNVSCRCRSDGGYITSNGLFIPTPCPSSTYIFSNLYPTDTVVLPKTNTSKFPVSQCILCWQRSFSFN